MAEAIVNARRPESWTAYSAGTQPVGYVHPKALQVLKEVGIHHVGRSKPVEEMQGIPFDLVITVCDQAAETCPLWLGPEKRIHHNLEDPARDEGSQAEVLAAFRRVRDKIITEILPLLDEENC
jgi:arsenate reductase